MRSDAVSHPAGLVVFVGCDPRRPGELPWPSLAAIEVADAVLYDVGVAAETLALVPRRSLAEAAGDGSRARKLAQEGWRVVRLVRGDPAAASAEWEGLAAAGLEVRALAGHSGEGSGAAVPAPQAFATPLNGLAG
jgi:siroheme synthase